MYAPLRLYVCILESNVSSYSLPLSKPCMWSWPADADADAVRRGAHTPYLESLARPACHHSHLTVLALLLIMMGQMGACGSTDAQLAKKGYLELPTQSIWYFGTSHKAIPEHLPGITTSSRSKMAMAKTLNHRMYFSFMYSLIFSLSRLQTVFNVLQFTIYSSQSNNNARSRAQTLEPRHHRQELQPGNSTRLHIHLDRPGRNP